jgi:hypothetical protein
VDSTVIPQKRQSDTRTERDPDLSKNIEHGIGIEASHTILVMYSADSGRDDSTNHQSLVSRKLRCRLEWVFLVCPMTSLISINIKQSLIRL